MGRPRKLEDDIKRLRNEGYSYNQITKELGCSKGTVGYHLTPNEKNRAKKRLRNMRKNPLYRRSMEWEFKSLEGKDIFRRYPSRVISTREYIRTKYDDKCWITGRKLSKDLRKIVFDHKIPKARGGSNDISNMGPATPEGNASKSDMLIEEYLELCKDALEYHGYIVIKKD